MHAITFKVKVDGEEQPDLEDMFPIEGDDAIERLRRTYTINGHEVEIEMVFDPPVRFLDLDDLGPDVSHEVD